MTSGTEMTRRGLRTARDGTVDVIPPAVARRAAPRWSRRRSVVSVFAAFAAVAFTAAYVGPMGGALAGAQAEPIDPVSYYADAIDDAQSYVWADATAATGAAAALDRDGYSAYTTPKPTPTPTPTPTRGANGDDWAVAPLFYSGGGSKSEWLSAAGIAEGDWGYVDYIVNRESTWNPNATNKSSGACGLVQALPCSKVPGNGYDPVDNLRWATGYAVGRYGSWAKAYDFWTANHWW